VDGDGFIRLAEVQTATTARVATLIDEYNADLPEAERIRQSPTFHGPEATRSLPLAVPATDTEALVARLALRVGQQGYTEDLHARLAEELTAGTAPADLRREAERFADRGGRFFASIAAVELGDAGNSGSMTPAPLVVAADGSGDHHTIRAALAAAPDGGRVTVRPGLYRENGLTIDRAVTLEGVGPREQVVIEASDSDALHLKAPVATVKGLTLRCTAAPDAKMTGLWVSAGAPLVEDCVATSSSIASIYVAGDGTAPTLRNCRAENGVSYGLYVLEKAAGTYENCLFVGHADDGVTVKGAGTNPTLRACRVENGSANGFVVYDQAGGLFENCTSTGNAGDGVEVFGAGTAPTFRGCRVEDAAQDGFLVHHGAGGTFERCVALRAKERGAYVLKDGTAPTFLQFRAENCTRGGLLVHLSAAGTYEDCIFIDNGIAGISAVEGANPTVKRCRVEGSDIGLFVVGARGTYEDAVFSDAKTHGMHIGRAGANPTVRRCRVENAKGHGLLVNEGGSGVFEDCTLTGSGQAGITVAAAGTSATIRGGASIGNAWQGVRVQEQARATVSGVDLRNNRRGAWQIGADAGPVSRSDNRE
ncbi:right-handed parallel beta-helix repeat-containing protein, partial [Alienimonas sp. DA493]|uniref:right-handed parallel beta-helix repeat-containing protein n=1 Tax=Alienimonas sp. DA493 TaxID=3373605 RepID=UPI003754FBDF